MAAAKYGKYFVKEPIIEGTSAPRICFFAGERFGDITLSIIRNCITGPSGRILILLFLIKRHRFITINFILSILCSCLYETVDEVTAGKVEVTNAGIINNRTFLTNQILIDGR